MPPAPVTRMRRPPIRRAIAVAVEHRLRPAEQVLDRDRLDEPRRVAEVLAELGQPRQARQRDRQRVGAVEQPADLGAAEVLRREDQLLRPAAAAVEIARRRLRARRSCRAPARHRSADRPATRVSDSMPTTR